MGIKYGRGWGGARISLSRGSVLSREYFPSSFNLDGSVAEWLACCTQAQKARVQIAAGATLSGNSLRQTVHTHCASVHQAAKFVAALSRVAGVTAGLAESNGNLPPGSWLMSPAGWLPRTGTLRSVIEYGLPLPFLFQSKVTDWACGWWVSGCSVWWE